jgi:hypothetical protein
LINESAYKELDLEAFTPIDKPILVNLMSKEDPIHDNIHVYDYGGFINYDET